MTGSYRSILFCLIILFLLNPLTSNAIYGRSSNEEIVDQSQVAIDNGLWNRYITQQFIPTFSLLSKIEVALMANEDAHYPVKISIREKRYGNDIVSTMIPADEISLYPNASWVQFDFEDIQVEPGKMYYIVIAPTYGSRFFQKVPKSEHIYWMLTWNNTYANGTSYISKSQRFLWPFDYLLYNHNIDFCFRTYTKTNPMN